MRNSRTSAVLAVRSSTVMWKFAVACGAIFSTRTTAPPKASATKTVPTLEEQLKLAESTEGKIKGEKEPR